MTDKGHYDFVKKLEDQVVYMAIAEVGSEQYNLRNNPPADGLFEFKKVLYFEDGSIDCIKYRFGDRFLFIFSTWSNLVVTKSLIDLSGDEDTFAIDCPVSCHAV